METIISRHFTKHQAHTVATAKRRATWGNLTPVPNQIGVWQCLEYRVRKRGFRLRRWVVIEK
jgi:hypothetical protein